MSGISTVAEGLAQIFALPLLRLTLSNPRPGAEYQKIVGRTVPLRGETVLQLEKFTRTQAFHENVPLEEAPARVEALLTQYGQLDAACRGAVFCLKISKKGKLFFQRQAAAQAVQAPMGHDRKKQYLLPEGEIVPPLVDLGVLTPDGRVVKAKYDKYKQINRFLEFLDDLLAKDGGETVRVVDFGCGKSYLTFVVYHYITAVLHKKAEIVGLDLKADVIDHCNRVAEKYGYTGLHFFCGDIRDYQGERPDLVITLHACDTATDLALFHAVEWGSKYILSVPCCQHELNAGVKASALPPVTGYGILKERFCALATDAVRARLLESRGYEVQVMEFIDLAHSPKNLLIRARKGRLSPEKRQKARDEAEKLLTDLGCDQTLRRLLEPERKLPAPLPAGLRIRRAVPDDIPEIMALYDLGRDFMRKNGNTLQWVNGYPYQSMIEEDIRRGNSFVCEAGGELQAVFALIWGEDPTYAHIDGAWLQNGPYGTVHRLAARGKYPGIATHCLRWCFDLCGDLRADTGDCNTPMRHTLEKVGFVYCGEIICDDGTPRRAYQKIH